MVLIDELEDCKIATNNLLKEDEIAVDIEGISLSRDGKISLIQVSGRANPEDVYIFDITTLGNSAFLEGGLKKLFEDQRIQKILYDGRRDNDALFHLYKVIMRNVYDLQILFVMKFSDPRERHVKGLGTALKTFGISTRDIETKEVGLALFAPEKGGRREVWEERPLPDVLLKYAECDIKYLHAMKDKWSNESFNNIIPLISAKRINKIVKKTTSPKGKNLSFRDF